LNENGMEVTTVDGGVLFFQWSFLKFASTKDDELGFFFVVAVVMV
jgi:hypothetical protein